MTDTEHEYKGIPVGSEGGLAIPVELLAPLRLEEGEPPLLRLEESRLVFQSRAVVPDELQAPSRMPKGGW